MACIHLIHNLYAGTWLSSRFLFFGGILLFSTIKELPVWWSASPVSPTKSPSMGNYKHRLLKILSMSFLSSDANTFTCKFLVTFDTVFKFGSGLQTCKRHHWGFVFVLKLHTKLWNPECSGIRNLLESFVHDFGWRQLVQYTQLQNSITAWLRCQKVNM